MIIKSGKWFIVATALLCVYGTLGITLYDTLGRRPSIIQVKWNQHVKTDICDVNVSGVVKSDDIKN